MKSFLFFLITGLYVMTCITSCSDRAQSSDPVVHKDEAIVIYKGSDNEHGALAGDDNKVYPSEICYKGIRYVFFPNGNASWGSVMYKNNGAANPTVATCD